MCKRMRWETELKEITLIYTVRRTSRRNPHLNPLLGALGHKIHPMLQPSCSGEQGAVAHNSDLDCFQGHPQDLCVRSSGRVFSLSRRL